MLIIQAFFLEPTLDPEVPLLAAAALCHRGFEPHRVNGAATVTEGAQSDNIN